MTRRHALRSFVSVALIVVSAACSSDPKQFVPTPVDTNDMFSVVIIGDRASAFRDGVAFRDLWSSQFVREAMPQTATLFNLSGRFTTADESMTRAVPLLSTVKPKVVAIWLGFDDIDEGVAPTQYAKDIVRVAQSARATGATHVLVGTLPKVLPNASAYNVELRAAISTTGSVVDLDSVPIDLEIDDGRLVPNVASLARVAEAFARVYSAVK